MGAIAALNDSLFGMGISDDGSYVYVGPTGNPALYRLTLPSLTPDITIALGSSGDPCCGGGANTVNEVAVAPGAAHTVVVSLAHPHRLYTGGTVVFDDAVARPQTLQPLGYYAQPDAIAWGASGAALGQFMLPTNHSPAVALLPDPSHGRVFALQTNLEDNHLLLLKYDVSSFALQSVIDAQSRAAPTQDRVPRSAEIR